MSTKDNKIENWFKKELQEDLENTTLYTLEFLEKETDLVLSKYNEFSNEVINYINLEYKSKIYTEKRLINYMFVFNENIKRLDEAFKNVLNAFSKDTNIFTKTNLNFLDTRIQNKLKMISKGISSQKHMDIYKFYTISHRNSNLINNNNIIKDIFESLKIEAIYILDELNSMMFSRIAEYFEYKNDEIYQEFIFIKDKFKSKDYNIKDMKEHLLKIQEKYDYLKKYNSEFKYIDNSISTSKRSYNKEPHYNFKELNKMAENEGYKLDRYNGDHAIYTKNNHVPVVIPQKNLRKGIMLSIKKSIYL